MARRTILLLAAGLLATAGCVGTKSPPPQPPPPPPRATQVCGQSFTTPQTYQDAYFNLGHANTGWVTADGFVPVDLPNGTTAWWMSDTMTGTATPDNSVPDAANVHNSLVLQGGSCLTPKLGSPEFIPGPSGRWYWPGSALVEGNTLLLFAYLVAPSADPPPFNFAVLGTTAIRYSLPRLTLEQVTNLPVHNAPAEPYKGGQIPWGIRSLNVDGSVYLYGMTRRSNLGPADIWLARAPLAQVTDVEAWEFFTGLPAPADWSDDFALAQPMSFPITPNDATAPLGQFSVVQYGDKYLGSAISDVLDTRVRAWIADSPQGPWEYLGVAATAERQNEDQIVYDGRIANLPGAEWTVVYNVNDTNTEHQKQDFTLYRGQFATPAGLPPESP